MKVKSLSVTKQNTKALKWVKTGSRRKASSCIQRSGKYIQEFKPNLAHIR